MGRPRKSEEEKRENRNTYNRANYHRYKEYREEKIRCECGALVSRAYISDHRKKNKHIEMVNFLKKNNVCIKVEVVPNSEEVSVPLTE